DIRYAGSDNFVGRPLPGYEVAECILRRDVAAALKRVQADLAASGLSLKVYDCYRPARAVRAMAGGVDDGRSQAPPNRFFPEPQQAPLGGGGHCRPPGAALRAAPPPPPPGGGGARGPPGPPPEGPPGAFPPPPPRRPPPKMLSTGPRFSPSSTPRPPPRPPP